MTNLQNAMIQLTEQLGQNLSYHMASEQIAAQLMHLSSHGRESLEESRSIPSIPFVTWYEMFMAGRLVEFAIDCTKMTFVLSLWKEVAAKWAIIFIEGNDSVLDNYQGFIKDFGEPMQPETKKSNNIFSCL